MVYKREESRVFPQNLLSPLEQGQRVKSEQMVCSRAGDRPGGLDLEEWREG